MLRNTQVLVFLTKGSPQMSQVIETFKMQCNCVVFTSLRQFEIATFKKRLVL